MMQFKADTSGLKAMIARVIARQDELSKKVAEQMLIEGKNVAHLLVPKDTGNLNDGIDRASNVERIAPSIYKFTLSSDAPYTNHVEFGTRKMTGKPFLRPAGFIARQKIKEVCERVYEDG